ncbi:unnamed protein product [Rotaria magnacalcarata]|uniref:Uncharacterized protein n=2 Tax=Rotaria magnacalcarata TaxID=392030 RepID=A0A8S2U1W3_9BILA|nr:unnamed protein product [Rotaria magnacalcarata]
MSLPFHLIFVQFEDKVYLTVPQHIYTPSVTIQTKIARSQYCPHIRELFNQTLIAYSILRRIKYYHLTCMKDSNLGFLRAVAYSSSIGGLSSLVGTAPNVYLKGFVERLFQCRPPFERFEVQTHLKPMLNKQHKDLGRPKHISDGTATIFCGILPLTLPDSNPFNRKILFSTFTLNETNADKR